MVTIRARRLKDGSPRWDIKYKPQNRTLRLIFDNPSDAEAFAHLINLRRHRWPLAPLLDRTGLTARQLARALGLSRKVADSARHRGLTDVQADHWATAMGLHPIHVWGWDWVTAAEPPQAVDGEVVA